MPSTYRNPPPTVIATMADLQRFLENNKLKMKATYGKKTSWMWHVELWKKASAAYGTSTNLFDALRDAVVQWERNFGVDS
jgi:hypothetical protein